jgi:hypothetical protein
MLTASLSLLLATRLLTGCISSPQQQVVWSDPSLGIASTFLRGKRVLVDCDSADAGLRQRCNSALSREVAAGGGEPLQMPAVYASPVTSTIDEQLTAAATAMGATAVFTVTLSPGSANPAPGLSLGLGGFSFGGDGGVGVGLSAPIASSAPVIGLNGSGQITDPVNRRLLWSATFAATPSADLGAQAEALVSSLASAAKRSGLF